ncbi:MAG: S1 RNA-binding domain-containing protein, partial [Pseudomonadota bacterium]
MSESFAELFEQSLKVSKIQPGGLLMGEVMRIDNDFVVIDAGLKSEGIIPAEQFRDGAGLLTVKVGDHIEVVLEYMENGHGETQLSREKAQRAKAWDELDKAHEAQSIVKGVITEKVKGGFTVLVDGVRAFLPGSLVDVRPVRDSTYLEGKELE